MNNFLTEEQEKKIKSLNWETRPKGFYITLFKKDFGNHEWKEICLIAGVSVEVNKVTLLSVGVKTN